jgi:hypothetical protein
MMKLAQNLVPSLRVESSRPAVQKKIEFCEPPGRWSSTRFRKIGA